ncbi:hypothetical protein C8F01DRAFT_986298 [Mycena amicta]|nr:hypothetical protein C8F01DRAFT_986298 [Mycena amicta]
MGSPLSPFTSASSTNLARYATAKSPDLDPFNGSSSRDFCNSFWGEGDAGVSILFARMRGAIRTTDELRKFWQERAVIEEEYANRLLDLAKVRLGKDEIGDLRNCLDTLLLETTKHGTTHLELATQIRTDMEVLTTELLKKQISHRKHLLVPLEKRFVEKQSGERVLVQAREKYTEDCLRVSAYTQHLQKQQEHPRTPGPVEHLQPRSGPGLRRAQAAIQIAEKAIAELTRAVRDSGPQWEKDWKDFCDASQDLEEDRLDVTKDVIWVYANAVSTLCVADDQACERVRTALEQLEPELDVLGFVQDYGTGNALPDLPTFVPFDEKRAGSSSSSSSSPKSSPRGHAQYSRASARPAPQYQSAECSPSKKDGFTRTVTRRRPLVVETTTPLSSSKVVEKATPLSEQPQRLSGPLPLRPTTVPAPAPSSAPTQIEPVPPPTPAPPEGKDSDSDRVLFYGSFFQALYDYKATSPEEFDFQPGDVIAVTATPPDGWWLGELLDERRRVEGRNVFPSNYVTLF